MIVGHRSRAAIISLLWPPVLDIELSGARVGGVSAFRPILNTPPRVQPTLVGRGFAGLAGVVLLPLAVYGTAVAGLVIAVGAQIPDREVPSGDPCCPHPDTWLETISWSGIGLVGVLICAGGFALSAGLLWWAVKAAGLSLRRAAGLGIAGVLVPLVAFSLVLISGEG